MTKEEIVNTLRGKQYNRRMMNITKYQLEMALSHDAMRYLRSYGGDYDIHDLAYLVVVDYYIQRRRDRIMSAHIDISHSRINISTIAADAGYSRKTLSDHTMIAEYIRKFKSKRLPHDLMQEIESEEQKRKNAKHFEVYTIVQKQYMDYALSHHSLGTSDEEFLEYIRTHDLFRYTYLQDDPNS